MASKQEHTAVTYQIIRGFPCPASERFSTKNIEEAMDFVPGDSDLIIASYPKTGTTWMQYIVLQIMSKGELFPSINDASRKFVPYIEMTGVGAISAQSKPRLYKHHIAYNFVQKNERSKTIYTYRHPEDTVVSYYHFLQDLHPEAVMDFNKFFDNFLAGSISYGSYFRHVLSFYEHREDDNLLMVSYKKLHANTKEEILRIAKFVSDEYHESLLEDHGLLDNILEKTSFSYMKRNLSMRLPETRIAAHSERKCNNYEVNFFRKGVVGDGKVLLTEEQRQCLRKTSGNVLKGTSVINEWYPQQNTRVVN